MTRSGHSTSSGLVSPSISVRAADCSASSIYFARLASSGTMAGPRDWIYGVGRHSKTPACSYALAGIARVCGRRLCRQRPHQPLGPIHMQSDAALFDRRDRRLRIPLMSASQYWLNSCSSRSIRTDSPKKPRCGALPSLPIRWPPTVTPQCIPLTRVRKPVLDRETLLVDSLNLDPRSLDVNAETAFSCTRRT